MTRVLMTADAVGGVWTYALELADALAPLGYEVTLAVMGPAMTPRQAEEARRSAVVTVHERDAPLEWMDHPWDGLSRAGEWLLELEDRTRPDVVHLNGYVHAALPWRAPTVVVGHSCVLSWWWAVHGTPAPAAWDRYRDAVASGLASAGAVVAPTAAMLRALQRWYGVTAGTVIANCRDSGWVRPCPKEPLVVGAGRLWDEAKNLRALDRVAPRIPWPVVVAGDARRPGSGTACAPPAVRTLGKLAFEDVAGWLLRASVFALPARYEPFGLAALEAGHAGCALVLGDIPSLREVWEDAAVYVDPADDDRLAAVLVELAEDADAVTELGARARARATEFSPARTAAGYAAVYERLPANTGGVA